MRIEVIKMTLQKRENSANNIVYEIERPLKIYGKFKDIRLFIIVGRYFHPSKSALSYRFPL